MRGSLIECERVRLGDDEVLTTFVEHGAPGEQTVLGLIEQDSVWEERWTLAPAERVRALRVHAERGGAKRGTK